MEINKHSGIYKIANTSNGKVYIGSAVNLYARVGAHMRMLRNGRHINVKLQRAWDKHGNEAFSFTVIEYVEDKISLLCREQFWIDFYDSSNTGYNIARIAGSLLGHKHSDETKSNMRAAATGHVKSDEHRRNLSLANIGKKMSDASRQKMREAKIGTKRNPHSEETKKRMSDKAKGRKFSDATLLKMSQAKLGKKQTQESIDKRVASLKARMK